MLTLAEFLRTLSVWLLPTLLAITLHEAAHAYVAEALGDPTSRERGRLTLNPIAHLDPVGTFLLPGILLIAGSGFIFGWAKAVPINPNHLRSPRRDMAVIAAAGPLTNLILATVGALLLHVVYYLPDLLGHWVGQNLANFIRINVGLALFNLLPLPPLDGGRVVVGVLPLALARPFARIEKFGILILMGGVVFLPILISRMGHSFNPLGWMLGKLVGATIDVILRFTGW